MSLSPVTIQTFKPNFTARPQGQDAAANLQSLTHQPGNYQPAQSSQGMQPFKPGFIARVRAFFTGLKETTKGAVVGMFYGAAAGVGAMLAVALKGKGASALKGFKMAKLVMAASTAAGLLVGAFAGKKQVSESIKGAGIGTLYGAAGGIGATVATLGFQKFKPAGPIAKAAMIGAVAVNTVIGAYVGKLIANGKIGKIYDQHGRNNWSIGK